MLKLFQIRGESNQNFKWCCRESIGQDTPGCWKNRISDLLKANSSLGLFSRQCIDEYNDGDEIIVK